MRNVTRIRVDIPNAPRTAPPTEVTMLVGSDYDTSCRHGGQFYPYLGCWGVISEGYCIKFTSPPPSFSLFANFHSRRAGKEGCSQERARGPSCQWSYHAGLSAGNDFLFYSTFSLMPKRMVHGSLHGASNCSTIFSYGLWVCVVCG